MNLHALQTLPAIAEAQELMIVPRLIITAQSNRPVMGIVQDTLLGSRLFSRRDVFIPRDVMMNIALWIDTWDGRLPRPAVMKPTPGRPGRHTPLWTGKQVFSMFMPDVNYERDSQGAPTDDKEWKPAQIWPDDTHVIIQSGELLTGIVDKAILGNKGGSLLHVIMNDVTPEATRDFINTVRAFFFFYHLQLVL
jgi:DNA-directed RNA polymerase II subunit RPB1